MVQHVSRSYFMNGILTLQTSQFEYSQNSPRCRASVAAVAKGRVGGTVGQIRVSCQINLYETLMMGSCWELRGTKGVLWGTYRHFGIMTGIGGLVDWCIGVSMDLGIMNLRNSG